MLLLCVPLPHREHRFGTRAIRTHGFTLFHSGPTLHGAEAVSQRALEDGVTGPDYSRQSLAKAHHTITHPIKFIWELQEA